MKKRIYTVLAACIILSALLALGVTSLASTSRDSVTVVGSTTRWKYTDNNTDPAKDLASLHAWTEKDFDDSAWKSGAGSFGALEGKLKSIDGFKPSVLLQQYQAGTEKNIPAYFFRTKFNANHISDVTSVTGSLFTDDAMAVYINGVCVSSLYMPSGTQTTNLYYAGDSKGTPVESIIYLDTERARSVLVEGENILAVELHNDRATSSDIYFEFESLTLHYDEKGLFDSVILNVGSDESMRGITWYSAAGEGAEVHYAPASEMTDGEFPAKYAVATAKSAVSNRSGFYSNKATMTELSENTEYVYRLVSDGKTSDIFYFKTGDVYEFSFAFVGDPQIGASGNGDFDKSNWNNTLEVINDRFDVEFLLSAGDQVNRAENEEQYSGFISDSLTSLATATSVGNHDTASDAYSEHFYLPNASTSLGVTDAGSDYWFVYGNTLFLCLNTNDASSAEHRAFMKDAIEKNPDVIWKVAVFHHSIYSTASHATQSGILTRRTELSPIFDELDIDIVLMGHDHVYTRTYMMNIFTPDKSLADSDHAIDHSGILYLTVNSSSGSKYYDITVPNAPFAAKIDQSYRKNITIIDVTPSSFAMTTYYADDMTVLDKFTVYKTDRRELKAALASAKALDTSIYTEDSIAPLTEAMESADAVLADTTALQEDIDAARDALLFALSLLTKPTVTTETTTVEAGPDSTTAPPEVTTATSPAPTDKDMTYVAVVAIVMMCAATLIVIFIIKRKR